ncbi:hypothetical protein F5X99DRAFT_425141 [Biscogniauxia marginata]|nr:hypothetical protein F5X99DRAFT_425141 [Biscogniauxia marginata]
MGLGTKLKGVLSDYKYRRNSSSTAQASLYRDIDMTRTPDSNYPSDAFWRVRNISNNNSFHESWFSLRNPNCGSEELSPKTSKFTHNRKDNTSDEPSVVGLNLGEHRPDGADDEAREEDNQPRVRGLRKPNYAGDPLYHQWHYKLYRQQQAPSPPPPQPKEKKKKNDKKARGLDAAAPKQQAETTVDGAHVPTRGSLHSRPSSKPSLSSRGDDDGARTYHTHRPQPSSSSTSSLFFARYSSNPSYRPSESEGKRTRTGTVSTGYTTCSSSRFDDGDDSWDDKGQTQQARLKHRHDTGIDAYPPPLYTSALSPKPRGHVLRETIPSSAVFGSGPGQPPWCANTGTAGTANTTPTPTHPTTTTGNPDRQSIIVGIDSSGVLGDIPASPGPSPDDELPIQRPETPPQTGHAAPRAQGSGSSGGAAELDCLPKPEPGIADAGGGTVARAGSRGPRVSIGAVGGAEVIVGRVGGGGGGSRRGGRAGVRVVHRCEGCGVDNDISRYFGKEAVYRML